MECKVVSELIPSVLDGELRADERPSIERHLNECSRCRNELELQSMAKRIVQHRLHRVAAPQELSHRIFSTLQLESEPVRGFRWADIAPFRLSWKPLVAFGGALAIILVVFLMPSSKSQHSHAGYINTSDGDIIYQTYDNFDKLLTGSMAPQISSNDPFDVEQFFAQKANFKVSVPKMKRCKLMGGSYSSFHNAPVAHLVYKRGNSLIYLYQVKLQDVLDENALQLPEDVKQELLANCSYIQNHQPNCTFLIRIVDSTVCCYVADVPKEELLSYVEEIQ